MIDAVFDLFMLFWAAGAALVVVTVCVVWWSDWKRAALIAITDRLPVKVLQRPGEPRYVEWYHVATPLRLFRIHIHRFVGDDPDGVHDHPWDWALSFLLLGEYDEDRRGRGFILRTVRRTFGYAMTGDTFHRVRLPAGQREVWSLFIFGPYTKAWGFLRLVAERGEYVYTPRGGNEDRFDPWPLHARTGRQLRWLDECEELFGVGAQ